MSSNDEKEKEKEKETEKEKEKEKENENDNENDNNIIKQLNDSLDEIIDKSKSFEGQIESIRKVENLDEYRFMDDYGDKELKFKIFKLELVHFSNIIEKKIFEQIFSHTFETLANKLINTTNEKENQIIVNNINENKKKTFRRKTLRRRGNGVFL